MRRAFQHSKIRQTRIKLDTNAKQEILMLAAGKIILIFRLSHQ
jgi:hypothetical protein